MVLANCHLAPEFLPALARLVEGFAVAPPRPGFRLWLLSAHTAAFPTSLLHSCVKVATQQPQASSTKPFNGFSECSIASKLRFSTLEMSRALPLQET